MSTNNLNTLLSELLKQTLNSKKLDKIVANNKDIKINAFVDEKNKQTLLHKVVLDNKLLSAKWLLENHANPYIEDINGMTPFFLIVHSKIPRKFLDLFIEFHIDLDYKNPHKRILLQDSILSGNYPLTKKIIEKTKKPFSSDIYGRNILFDAISSGSIEIIDFIYNYEDKNKDLNICDIKGNSLLHHFKDTKISTLEFLIKSGVSPAIADANGKNIIFYLSEKLEKLDDENEINQISKLIELALEYKTIIDQKDKEGNNLLLSFLKNLNKPLKDYKQKNILANIITKFIDSGIDIDYKDDEGNNALFIASSKNDIESTKLLLEKGLNVNETNSNEHTALVVAFMRADKSYFEMIKLLLSYGANPNIKDANNINLIEMIIYILIYINCSSKVYTPSSVNGLLDSDEILNSFGEGKFVQDVLEFMLSNRIVEVNDFDSQGNPYFFLPLLSSDEHTTMLFFRFGANINQENKNGDDILFFYLNNIFEKENNNIDEYEVNLKIKRIIYFGFDINKVYQDGSNILHRSIIYYPISIVKNIISCNANINSVDFKNRNILHTAIWTNDLTKVKYVYTINNKLLNSADKFGVLPINYAAFMGNEKIISYLIAKGSHVNNTYQKPKHILNSLKRFHKNIIKLEEIKTLPLDEKNKILILTKNMRKEFNIID